MFAQHANVDAARAAFFPQISLTGSAGYSALSASSLVNPASFAWSIGASLLQPIFDGGKLKAAQDQAMAQEAASIATYRKTVFQAFSDAETWLGTVKADADQIAALTEELRAATEAFRISELEYREGTIDIVTLTTAQTTLFGAENALASARLSRLEASVNLYRYLGGGWNQTASDAAYTYQLEWWPL